MRMSKTLAELIAKTDPKLYQKYPCNKKGKKVLYLRLKKALYGMMKSVLLFYRKLVSELKTMGFTINPCDPCIANKTVSGSQMTVRWHVGDHMISHKNIADINVFLKDLKAIYGDNLAGSTGKKHHYIGMIFDFSFPEEVRINMTLQISKNNQRIPQSDLGKAGNACRRSPFQGEQRTGQCIPLHCLPALVC